MSRVDLPNDKWVRSEVKPEWALNFDKDSTFFGWKMYESADQWVSGGIITARELDEVIKKTPDNLLPFLDEIKLARERLK